MKVSSRATMLMVSWKVRNLRMFSLMERPHRTAETMDEKLSSMMTMAEASLAISVPAMPMARPTSAASAREEVKGEERRTRDGRESAALTGEQVGSSERSRTANSSHEAAEATDSPLRSAAASLVPSPVTATTCPDRCSASTARCLSVGEERASTARMGSAPTPAPSPSPPAAAGARPPPQMAARCSGVSALNSRPSSTSLNLVSAPLRMAAAAAGSMSRRSAMVR